MNVILLSKRKFRENANIINVFSNLKVKFLVLFMVEIQEKLEIIYKFQINYLLVHNSKNENKLGYFKTELIKPISPLFLMTKKELLR